MNINKKIAAIAAAVTVAATMSGCAAAGGDAGAGDEIFENPPDIPAEQLPPEEESPPAADIPAISVPEEPPAVKTVRYISVTGDNVNIRSGAGTGYSSVGTAEKSTMYAYLGEKDGWYITKYRNKTVYISKKYCVVTEMDKSDNEKIEAVIAEGTNVLGTPYVYGAVRLHDGKGNKLKGFSINAFDCSSLMQYMFYEGAGTLLQVNTRTQVYQGTTVSKSKLKRGDLMFFTNASRKNNTGIERIGHVAIYLGDNWILHTASDYAKIEQISSTRWGYYIQSQRMI